MTLLAIFFILRILPTRRCQRQSLTSGGITFIGLLWKRRRCACNSYCAAVCLLQRAVDRALLVSLSLRLRCRITGALAALGLIGILCASGEVSAIVRDHSEWLFLV